MSVISKGVRLFFKQKNQVGRFAITLKRRYRLAQWNKQEVKILEISGGRRPLDKDYLNVDIAQEPEVDVEANLLEPLPFADQSVDGVVSVATLEHFNIKHIRLVLMEMYRVIKPGGTLTIGVPSLPKIIAEYQKTGCTDTVIRYLHGAQKDEYDVHYFVVDGERFIEELRTIGFSQAKEVEYDFPRHDANLMMKLVATK